MESQRERELRLTPSTRTARSFDGLILRQPRSTVARLRKEGFLKPSRVMHLYSWQPSNHIIHRAPILGGWLQAPNFQSQNLNPFSMGFPTTPLYTNLGFRVEGLGFRV